MSPLTADRRSQKSSKRPLSLQQRCAMMASTPWTVQCMPDLLHRVGPQQGHRAEHGFEGLGMPPCVPSQLPTLTGQRGSSVVRCVGIQSLFDCPGRHAQRLSAPPSRWPPSPSDGPSQDLGGLRFPRRSRSGSSRRAPFFSCPVASTGRASQISSLTSSKRSHVVRKSRYVWTSRSILQSNGPGRSCRVLVLPATLVVKA